MNTKSIISVILFALPLFLGGQIICDSCPPTVDLTADGSSAATFLWSNNDNTPTTTVSAAGSYFVTVTEPGGCPGVLEYQVSFTQPTINSIQVVDDPCFQPSVTIQVFGAFPMTINFGNGIVVNNVTTNFTTINNSVPTGTFTATVTDANGCTATQSYTVDDGTCCTCNPIVVQSGINGSCALTFFANGSGCGEYNYRAERSTNGGASWSLLFLGSAPVNQNYTPTASGLYRLRLIPENGSDCNGEIISNEFNFDLCSCPNNEELTITPSLPNSITVSCESSGLIRVSTGNYMDTDCMCCSGNVGTSSTNLTITSTNSSFANYSVTSTQQINCGSRIGRGASIVRNCAQVGDVITVTGNFSVNVNGCNYSGPNTLNNSFTYTVTASDIAGCCP